MLTTALSFLGYKRTLSSWLRWNFSVVCCLIFKHVIYITINPVDRWILAPARKAALHAVEEKTKMYV